MRGLGVRLRVARTRASSLGFGLVPGNVFLVRHLELWCGSILGGGIGGSAVVSEAVRSSFIVHRSSFIVVRVVGLSSDLSKPLLGRHELIVDLATVATPHGTHASDSTRRRLRRSKGTVCQRDNETACARVRKAEAEDYMLLKSCQSCALKLRLTWPAITGVRPSSSDSESSPSPKVGGTTSLVNLFESYSRRHFSRSASARLARVVRMSWQAQSCTGRMRVGRGG